MSLDAAVEVVTGTVVFTDIVGFTAFTADEGDDRALEVLGVQETAVVEALPPGARVVKELGDGLMLWFPDAASAVVTSLRLQAELADRYESEEFPLWVRMGAHHGTQRCRREDLVGHDVNVAARIVDLAAPGEVLVSEATVAAARRVLEGVEFAEVGPVVVKGIPDAVWIYRAELA
ncbi:MAG: adenylate/guanylate cyclase domain-containing protein [Acidimicrobiia bacterium]|nr:adenylate/guanylate cyclase domain-containing protein [Acidimicrobiia bacterium]